MIDARFVIMTDTHFSPPGKGQDSRWWNRTLGSRSAEIGEALISTVKNLSPDYIIHCGDFTHPGDVESFQFGVDIMDRMACPYYIILGNHDAQTEGIRKSITTLIENENGNLYYSRDLAGLRFIFLDSANWITKDGKAYDYQETTIVREEDYSGIGPSQDVLDWLKNELTENQDQPTIIVTHAPIHSKPTYPVETLQTGKPINDYPTPYHHFASYSVHEESLRRMISQHTNIIAVFCGHWHISDITGMGGAIHCQTGALIEYPFEMRLMERDRNQLILSTIGLNDQKFKNESFIPEWNNQWVAGQPDDRTRIIILNQK